MFRHTLKSTIAVLAVFAAFTPAAEAQQGPVGRAGQALDNVGKNIRRGVEDTVARGQINAQERDLLARVTYRMRWDKKLVGSALRVEVQADGTTVLRGSVADLASKARAVDLVESTVGVTRVVDELAVVKEIKVIEAAPARVIIVPPPVSAPVETEVIIKKP